MEPGYRAIKFKRFQGGVQMGLVYPEGPNLVLLSSSPSSWTRARGRAVKTRTASKDLQNMNLSLRVLSKPEENFLPDTQDLGPDYDERVLPSMVNEVLKNLSRSDADHCSRSATWCRPRSAKTCASGSPTFTFCSTTSRSRTCFSADFSRYEDKQVASQRAEREKFIVMKAEQERIANIIRSKATPSRQASFQSYIQKRTGSS